MPRKEISGSQVGKKKNDIPTYIKTGRGIREQKKDLQGALLKGGHPRHTVRGEGEKVKKGGWSDQNPHHDGRRRKCEFCEGEKRNAEVPDTSGWDVGKGIGKGGVSEGITVLPEELDRKGIEK